MWEVWMAFRHGVDDFDFPGHVVFHEPGESAGERILMIEDSKGNRVSIRYVADPAMAIPVEIGTEVTLHHDAFFDDNGNRLADRKIVSIVDVAGRVLWFADVRRNSPSYWTLLPGLSVVSDVASCTASIQTGFGWELLAGHELTVRYRDGEKTVAPIGEIVSVAGSGATGKLQVVRAFDRPPECLDGMYPRSSIEMVFAATNPGPVGLECTLDSDCGATEYCERTAGTCDSPGYCVSRPTGCSWGDPVCACDGNVYMSACDANMAGVDTASTAECAGHYACGLFACRIDEEMCVRSRQQSVVSHCWPFSLCNMNDCGCVEERQELHGCACIEVAPGQFDVTCE